MAKENHHDKSLYDYPERLILKIQIGMDKQTKCIPCRFMYNPDAYNHLNKPYGRAFVICSPNGRDKNSYDWSSVVSTKNSGEEDEIKNISRGRDDAPTDRK